MDEGRKRVLAIVAGILVARHLKSTEDLFDNRASPRTEAMVAAAVQWAERIMRKIDRFWRTVANYPHVSPVMGWVKGRQDRLDSPCYGHLEQAKVAYSCKDLLKGGKLPPPWELAGFFCRRCSF